MISQWVDKYLLDVLNLYCASATLLYLCSEVATHEAIVSGLLLLLLWEAIAMLLTSKNRNEEDGRDHKVNVDNSSSFAEQHGADDVVQAVDVDRSKEVTIYRNGACVYADGSLAPVLPGLCTGIVPHEYLISCKGDHEKARKRYAATQEWRTTEKINIIHTLPHPHYYKILKNYPCFIHGYTKIGNPITWELAGKMNAQELFAEGRDLIMHRAYSFYLEFIFNDLCSRPEILSRRKDTPPFSGKMFACILDLKGFNPFHLTMKVVKYCVRVSKINESHYPMSGQQGIFINAPNWLVNSFALLTHLVPENNKDSIIFLSSSNLGGLKELIDEDQIPKRYGGTSPYDFDQHPYMQEFYRVVDRANATPPSLSK